MRYYRNYGAKNINLAPIDDLVKVLPTHEQTGKIVTFDSRLDGLPIKTCIVKSDSTDIDSIVRSGCRFANDGRLEGTRGYDVICAPVDEGNIYIIHTDNVDIEYAFYTTAPSVLNAISAYDKTVIIKAGVTEETFTAPINGYVAFKTLAGSSSYYIKNPIDKLYFSAAGKNLFNIDSCYKLVSDFDYISSDNYNCKYVQLARSTSFRISKPAGSSSTKKLYINSKREPIRSGAIDLSLKHARSVAKTSDRQGRLFIGGSGFTSDDEVKDCLNKCKVQIEVGNVSTDYTPYNGNTKIVNLDQPICDFTWNVITGELINHDVTPNETINVGGMELFSQKGVNNLYSSVGDTTAEYYTL